MSDNIIDNIKNYLPMITLVFLAGVFFNGQQHLASEIDRVSERQDKKVKLLNENTDRIEKLELYRAWEEGVEHGKAMKQVTQ